MRFWVFTSFKKGNSKQYVAGKSKSNTMEILDNAKYQNYLQKKIFKSITAVQSGAGISTAVVWQYRYNCLGSAGLKRLGWYSGYNYSWNNLGNIMSVSLLRLNYVLLAFCAGNRITGNGLETTQITRLNLDWIYSTSE